jgi:serine/threonine protein kinase
MRKIGRYEILGLLGRGGMSLVYKVRLPVIEKIMALKLFHPHPLLVSLLGEGALKQRFITEAVLMAKLHHPHLLAVWDFDESQGVPFFVTEYYCHNLGTLIGESAEGEKPTRVLKADLVFHYARQILQGVARLHRAGIIHRDLKPFNFLITDEEEIKIGDFGLSLLRGEAWPSPDNLKVGSPYYAAPEQEQEPDRVDARADLYSIGVTLHRLVTGYLFPDDRPKEFPVNPDLDPDWKSFWSRGVALNKELRFNSAEDMLGHLEKLQKDWETKKGNGCPGPMDRDGTVKNHLVSPPLRGRPVRVGPSEARSLFDTDELWRPRHYAEAALQNQNDGTVLDRHHGLLWEQSGSLYPLTWPEAGGYVQALNQERFAGRSAWRLPTVNELLSLLTESPQHHTSCPALTFDPRKKCLWSADRRSFTAAWYVRIDLAFVFWQDFTCHYYVRAVSSV